VIRQAHLLRRGWPDKSIDLLIRALILQIDDARLAWRQWTHDFDFNRVSWYETRILSAISTRMEELEPRSPLRPRIDGLARAHWTRTQLTLGETSGAIDLLARAGIACMLIKGAAYYAEGLGAATRRVLSDIDILVRPEHATGAIEALVADGWNGTFGESAAYLRTVAELRISSNLLKGRYGEIDVHRTPFHYRHADQTADSLVWRDSSAATLNGRSVLVPNPADSVLISLAHASQSHGADWAIDVCGRLAHQTIDWHRLIELAGRWRLTLPLRCGLLYLVQRLQRDIPRDVIDRLSDMPCDWAQQLKFWSNVREPDARQPVDRIANRIANCGLRARGYELAVMDYHRLQVIQPLDTITVIDAINYIASRGAYPAISRPQPVARLTYFRSKQRIPIHLKDITWGTQATLSVGARDHNSVVAIELELKVPSRSRWIYFDLSRGERAFARIRAKMGGRNAGSTRRIAALVRVPPGPEPDIAIEARPTQFIRPTAKPGLIELAGALPFRVVRAATVGQASARR
jgi:hypothetical protein